MFVEEVIIDSRVHPRIIGTRGRGIARLMEEFSVDVRFPRTTDPDPNLVTISGVEDDVLNCKDELLNMEEELVSGASLDENSTNQAFICIKLIFYCPQKSIKKL